MPRQTCTDHCRGCGEHFHGLGAFDLHRRGGECHNPETVVGAAGSRKAGIPLLQAWTHDGSCDKENGCWQDGKRVKWEEGVTVWQVAVSEAQRERLRELGGKESDAAMQPSLLTDANEPVKDRVKAGKQSR